MLRVINSNNPILDTRMYEVDYFDGLWSSLSAHVIAVNLITQNDVEGNKFEYGSRYCGELNYSR